MSTVVGVPTKVDLHLAQGATFSLELTWEDDGVAKDLTGWTAAAQGRPSPASPDGDLLFDLTDTDGIVLGGTAGTILLTIDAATTAAMPAGAGRWDLHLTDGAGQTTRLVKGAVLVDPRITR